MTGLMEINYHAQVEVSNAGPKYFFIPMQIIYIPIYCQLVSAGYGRVKNILPRYANYLTWFRLSANQIVGFLIGPVPKPCLVPAPTTVKLPHASGHSYGDPSGPRDQNKNASLRNSRGLSFYKCVIHGITCTYFRIIIHSAAYHHLQITWLSYFRNENQGLTSLDITSSCVVT